MLVIDTLQRTYLYYQAASDNGVAGLPVADENIRQYVSDILSGEIEVSSAVTVRIAEQWTGTATQIETELVDSYIVQVATSSHL